MVMRVTKVTKRSWKKLCNYHETTYCTAQPQGGITFQKVEEIRYERDWKRDAAWASQRQPIELPFSYFRAPCGNQLKRRTQQHNDTTDAIGSCVVWCHIRNPGKIAWSDLYFLVVPIVAVLKEDFATNRRSKRSVRSRFQHPTAELSSGNSDRRYLLIWFLFAVHAIPKFSDKSMETLWGEVFRKAWGNLGRWGNIRERGDWWKVHNMFSSLVGEDYRKISSHLHQTIHQTKHFLKNVLWIYRWPVCSCEVSEASKEVMDFEKFCDWANIVLVVHIKFLFFLLFSYSVYSFLSSMVSAFKFFLKSSSRGKHQPGRCMHHGSRDRHHWFQTPPRNAPDFAKLPRFIQPGSHSVMTLTGELLKANHVDLKRFGKGTAAKLHHRFYTSRPEAMFFMFFCFVSALWVFENHSHCIICQAF